MKAKRKRKEHRGSPAGKRVGGKRPCPCGGKNAGTICILNPRDPYGSVWFDGCSDHLYAMAFALVLCDWQLVKEMGSHAI